MARNYPQIEVNGQSIRLFDSTHAAQYLGVAKGTLYSWVDNHDLQPVSINNGYVFTKDALDACRQYKNLDRKGVNIEYVR